MAYTTNNDKMLEAVLTDEYLMKFGKYNPTDAFGTSVESYMKRFAGYDVSKICI